MDYFKINYNKLKNIPEIKFYKLIFLLIAIIFGLLFLSLKMFVYEKTECLGIYQNNTIVLKVNTQFSDKLINSEYIIFNGKKMNFSIEELGEYEIVNNEVYQEISLVVDKKNYDNEVGIIEFYYDKKSIFKYVINLF